MKTLSEREKPRERVLGYAAALLIIVALTTSCVVASIWPKTRAGPVNMSDLMIDVSAFPPDWHPSFEPCPIPVRFHRGERESLYVEFNCGNLEPGLVGARHEVFRYRNELDGFIAFYSDFAGREFPDLGEQMITPWTVPEEWSYESSVADRFRFACAEIDVLGRHLRCHAVGQYDEFISVFSARVSPECLTLGSVEQVLRAIDERMALYLGDASE